MKLEEIQKLKVGDWFSTKGDNSLYYVTEVLSSGILYSSNSFLHSSNLYIGFDEKYSLIHNRMNYLGKTETNIWFWILPYFLSEMLCPYKKPNLTLENDRN